MEEKSKIPYKNLKTYQQAVIIYDLTVEFCERWIKSYKLREQMEGAARSGKQNIAEGASQGTSLKAYIKLLGVALGSLKELYEDYEDFARQRRVAIWPGSPKRDAWVKRLLFSQLEGYKRGKGYKAKFPLNPLNPLDPSWAVNYLLNLINMTTYLLTKQIESLEEKFIREGGYTENLFKRRLKQRSAAGIDEKN
ncbi:MAG: four helix bundle protein [Candidatus Cloacimonetes bacterium]|nr:four helix bundle protein [Candidatus Cloacimonadota bacterium]